MNRVLLLAVIAIAGCGGGKPKSEPTPPSSSEQADGSAAEPAAETTSVSKYVGANGGCNADALKEAGMQHINMGQHAAALDSLESSLECADDPYVRQLAFMEACASGNSKRARHYAKRITAEQLEKFGHICDRQKPRVPYR